MKPIARICPNCRYTNKPGTFICEQCANELLPGGSAVEALTYWDSKTNVISVCVCAAIIIVVLAIANIF